MGILLQWGAKKGEFMSSSRPLSGLDLKPWIRRVDQEGNREYGRRVELSQEIIRVWRNKEKTLDLARKLGEQRITELPEAIGRLTFLKILDVGDNDHLATLPPLGNLTNLTFLRLSGNSFTLQALLPLVQLPRSCVIYAHQNPTLSLKDLTEICQAVQKVRKVNPKIGPTFYPVNDSLP